MECVKGRVFMSEQDNLYLGSIGLLGEYCPTSKKRLIRHLERVGCMHLESFQEVSLLQGCNWGQPTFAAVNQLFIEDCFTVVSGVCYV